MGKLIDADVFDSILQDAQAECKKNGGNFRFGVLNSVRANLANQPAVDVAPVKRGQWKAYSVPHWTKRYDDNGDPEYKQHNEYVCSICRRRTIVRENYCPNCGAKMDGDGDG